MNINKEYDVIVIGGGHSGIEAAHISAKMGSKTLLITLSIDSIGLMPCNPSVGGPGKSHIIFEIDALGGLMGKIADKTAINKKMLNLSRGPAVQSLRTQVDRFKYEKEMKETLFQLANLDIIQGEVKEILIEDNQVKGINLTTDIEIKGKSVVVATGTYLQSKVIIGDKVELEGPNGLKNSMELSKSLEKLGYELRRFKTGTPPRLLYSSINFHEVEQEKDPYLDYAYDLQKDFVPYDNVLTYSTYSNENTHEIIKSNLHRSPLLSGIIEGVGPRYCPSVEDKIRRFPDKDRHHFFLEPESTSLIEVYLQGFSSSLPADVQLKMVRSLKGLENAHILKFAYAIEYDAIDSQKLKYTLESKVHNGLFFAGQINGTSGYEEAGGQGIIAGINASLISQNKEQFILKRNESYIGVLIDDLISKGTKEPYRMFTSRAEYRLVLRQSNSDMRLSKYAYELGIYSPEEFKLIENKLNNISKEIERINSLQIHHKDPELLEVIKKRNSSPVDGAINAGNFLKRPEIQWKDLYQIIQSENTLTYKEMEEVALQIKYEGYIKKQLEQIHRFEKSENTVLEHLIPDYNEVKSLTTEAVEKLNYIKPYSLGQAGRISGVSPSDIQALLLHLEVLKRRTNND